MATETYYRKDFLTGYTIDTSNTAAIENLENAGYTTNFAEAEAASFTGGGQNFIGNTANTADEPLSDSFQANFTVEQAKVLLPYITKLDPQRGEKLIKAYVDGYIQSGKVEFALAALRAAPEYDEMFNGIKRSDGSLRMTEAQYLQNKEAVLVHFNEYNLGGYAKENIDTVFPKLLSNNVSPDEMRQRLQAVTDTINAVPQDQKAQILGEYQQYYSTELGEFVEPNESTLVALAIDPEVNAQILSKRLNVSQISATFERVTGEDIDFDAVQRLIGSGITAQRAASEFETATARAITASRLARRFNRQNQDYTALEFAEFGAAPDTNFMEQIGSLSAQAETESAVATGARQNREGQVTGLTEQ